MFRSYAISSTNFREGRLLIGCVHATLLGIFDVGATNPAGHILFANWGENVNRKIRNIA